MQILAQGRQVSIRRRLRGDELGMRYASLDASTLRREAIRGMLNPGNKPASQLNPLAVFAGAPVAHLASAGHCRCEGRPIITPGLSSGHIISAACTGWVCSLLEALSCRHDL